MNIITAICCRGLLVVVVLAVASSLATPSGPLSWTQLILIIILVLVLLASASLDYAPLRGDATLSNSLGAASLLFVASPCPVFLVFIMFIVFIMSTM